MHVKNVTDGHDAVEQPHSDEKAKKKGDTQRQVLHMQRAPLSAGKVLK